jgi:hypothetical protein
MCTIRFFSRLRLANIKMEADLSRDGTTPSDGVRTSDPTRRSPRRWSTSEVDVELPLENIQAAKNVWLYFIFILFYTVSTVSGRNYHDESSYDFVNG